MREAGCGSQGRAAHAPLQPWTFLTSLSGSIPPPEQTTRMDKDLDQARATPTEATLTETLSPAPHPFCVTFALKT